MTDEGARISAFGFPPDDEVLGFARSLDSQADIQIHVARVPSRIRPNADAASITGHHSLSDGRQAVVIRFAGRGTGGRDFLVVAAQEA